MFSNKNLIALTLLASTISLRADDLANAIIRSDYMAVAQELTNQPLSQAKKDAALELAEDIVSHKSNHFGYDWLKGFITRKLLLSTLATALFGRILLESAQLISLKDLNPDLYAKVFKNISYPQGLYAISVLGTLISAYLTYSAIGDGIDAHNALKEKLSDAEQIKFMLMAS